MKTKLAPGQEAPIEQWLAEMPEPYASAAIGQIDKNRKGYEPITKSIADAVLYFCDWDKTKELDNFWEAVNNYYEMAHKYPLPPYPTEHLPIEPALPDFYVGMEIVAKVAINQITEGKTYPIAQLVPKDCFMIINNLGIPHHVRHENFHKYFTLKNQPMNPTNQIDPNELKPAKEWLKYLPEPLRTEALEACEKEPYKPKMQGTFHQCIMDAFYWGEFEQEVYWDNIHNQIRNGEILPVQPEEVKEGKPETEIEKLSKAFNNHAETQEKRLQLMVDLYDKLQGKFEALQKELDERYPKKIETKAEPEPRKLPLTIEEVATYGKSLQDGKRKFFKTEIEAYFLSKKTQDKVDAFLRLSQIAEAQNEICERGDKAWNAVYDSQNNGIKPTHYNYPSSGEILFHSEQGLKDCIAANEQLFKDYLEIE